MPKISIITTTYKHEKFIAQTIKSVLAQTFTDWELLIGDDNSSDGTYEIALEFAKKDSRIKVWKNAENLGIVGNMNFLFSQVSTESTYISFLEGDDMYVPENLEEKLKIFKKYPELGFFYSHWDKIDAKSQLHKRTNKKESGFVQYTLSQFLASGNPIQSFGIVAMKRDVLTPILPITTPKGDNTGMFGPLDYWMWVQIVPHTTVYYSSLPIFQYRVHENNFVRNVSIMNTQIQLVYEEILKKNRDLDVEKICHFFIANNLMMSAFFEHDMKKVFKYGILSFQYNMRTFWCMRFAVMFASLFPWRIVDWLYFLYRR